MKHFLIKSLAALALAGVLSPEAGAAVSASGPKQEPLSRMRKVERTSKWSDAVARTGMRKAIGVHSTPQADDFQFIYGPDGSIWYATADYDTETITLEGGYATEDLIKGYTYTIYDSKFNEIGKIHDDIRFEEGEYRCARVMLDVTVTQKFFNLDAKYEVMIAVCMNADNYSVNTRTLVYSIGGQKENGCDKVIMTVPGYSIDAVDTATDPWGENYFISFLTEKTPDLDADYPEWIDYLGAFSQVITTYKRAGMNPEPSVVNVHEVPNLMLPGDQMDAPMMLSKNRNGKLTLIFSQYEKSFFVDPSGMGGNEDMTPDNNLLIDVYQLPSNSATEMNLISTTKIPAEQSTDETDVLYTFYGLGTFMYDEDVDFDHYTADGTPAFVVTMDKYLLSDDDQYRSTYQVYNADGELMDTLASDTYNCLELSDIPGEEPQVMFVYKGDTQMTFEFVDRYSCETVATIDQIQNGFVLSGNVDRVPTAGGYKYAAAYAQGVSDDYGDMTALVGWFYQWGGLERVDRINLGQNVQMAQVYIEANALSPYVFNTDEDLEYMVLVKRGMGEDSSDYSLREELLVVAPGKDPVMTLLPDGDRGNLAEIFLFGQSAEKILVVSYLDQHRVSADSWTLPLTRFQGGDGSQSSPYLIASAGDLQQMAACPSAHYMMVSDVDCGGVSFESVKEFTGSFDGAGHTIYNLRLTGSDNVSLFASAYKSAFKNVSFYNPSMLLSGSADDAALLVGTATMCEIEDVNVHGLNARGDSFRGNFGGLAGHLWSTSSMKTCAIDDAVIDLPNAETVGGLASEIRTGSTLKACLFSGKISADNTVGGIVGSTTTGDEIISDCRVFADIKAKNTVGGVVGYLNRSKVANNFVEGKLEVTAPSKWTNALSLGGIVGELRADWEKKSNVPVVNNVVAVESLVYPALDIPESYPHQCATVHRVVGRTVYNEQPETLGENPDGTPIYDDPVKEEGIYSNLVVNTLPTVDSDFSERSVEGTSIERTAIDFALLEENGFLFGETTDMPWRFIEPGYVKLFYERSLYVSSQTFNVKVGQEFDLYVESNGYSFSGMEFSYPEDMLELVDSFTQELEIDLVTGKEIATMQYTFYALKPGDAEITATAGGETVKCTIHISDSSGVESVAEGNVAMTYAGNAIEAFGCDVTVYSLSGVVVKSGKDCVDVADLAAGTYIAVAHSADGKTNVLKFRR